MGASAYVGRVGGLAVALGIGAAIATGQGVAWASPTESDSPTSEPSASAGADSGPGSGAASDPPTANSPESSPTSEPASEPSPEDSTSTSTSGTASTSSSSTRSAEPGKAISTGGAQTSRKVTDNADKSESDEDEDEPEKTADAVELEEARDTEVIAPEESEAAAAPAQTSTPRTITDEVPVEKKSSVRLTKKSSTPTSTVEVRTVNAVADKVDNTDEAADPVLQRTASAAEPTTLEAKSSMTTMQDVAPIMTAAPELPKPTGPRLLTNLLSALGLGTVASDTPGTPFGSSVAMAALALAIRRESERAFSTFGRTTTTGSTPVATLAVIDPPTAAVTAPYNPATDYVVTPSAVSPNTDIITNVTGPGGLNDTKYRFGIGGTDLGIMWDNDIQDDPNTPVNEHQVLIAFGDTFSNDVPVRTGAWRMNTLFRSTDGKLSNGMYVEDGIPHDPGTYSGSPMSDPRFSREIIGNYHYGIGPEVTMIPTAAISVPGAGANGATRQYINFMSVRSWDTPGRWTTNYSAIAYSNDNGQNWTVVPTSSVRPAAAGRSTRPFVSGNQNFQQGAYVKLPAGSPEAAEGWIYSYGTPSGRGGTVYLSRVIQDQILDQTKYQYWNGSTWVPNTPSAATPVLPGTTTSFFGFFKRTTYPTVGEMSVQYNAYEQKYIMLYADQNNNVVMRKADKPQGPWSAPTTLVTSTRMPGLYAPMIHPWSSTENVPEAEKQYLYWNLSTWDDYQVKMMRTDLSKV